MKNHTISTLDGDFKWSGEDIEPLFFRFSEIIVWNEKIRLGDFVLSESEIVIDGVNTKVFRIGKSFSQSFACSCSFFNSEEVAISYLKLLYGKEKLDSVKKLTTLIVESFERELKIPISENPTVEVIQYGVRFGKEQDREYVSCIKTQLENCQKAVDKLKSLLNDL